MKSQYGGYTVIEVMIVLAVSASLFFLVAALFGSRQGQTELSQSVRDLESRIQTVASDVANGYYPNGYKCNVGGGKPVISNDPMGSGENLGCVFLGKIINFRPQDAKILTLVGRQYVGNNGSAEVGSLAEAQPVAVVQAGTNVTDTYIYKYGLTITKIKDFKDQTITYGAFGFMSQLGNDATGNPLTGSRSTLLYGMLGTSPNNDQDTNTADKISDSSLVKVPNGILLCLKGGNGKNAEITIGESGNQTTTNVLIDTGLGGECA